MRLLPTIESSMHTRPVLLLATVSLLFACGDEPGGPAPTNDVGAADADSTDADSTDADSTDADSTDTTDDDAQGTDVDTTDTLDIGEDIDPTLDRDDDGIPDLDEITIWGTSPIVADSDGDGFSDGVEILDLAFDPEVDNFQFNPLVADRPTLDIRLALAPVIYATYETTSGVTESIGSERSNETREATSRSWGGSNSYAVEQTHTVGATVGFSGWSMEGSVSYEYSYSTTNETSNEWSNEQATENANTLSEMESYESSNEVASSGGVLGISVTIANTGDIAYFLDNLTLTAYELDPLNPDAITPVGTLTFLDTLGSGFVRTRLEPGEVSAPLTFDTDLDLPTVKALLADSRNLMIAPATWLVEGDGTVDFELAATAVNARTAEIIIDYGFDRERETYRVATTSHEDRNYITVEEALTDILRIPFTQGRVPFRRADELEPADTNLMLTSVRDYEINDEETALWTVIHSYPINSGADIQVDQYHPLVDELDFAALELQKGHTLQLIRIIDVDRDGLGERAEYAYGTDPNNPDTDGDGCDDGFEVVGWTVGEGADATHYRSNPTLANSDGDLFNDCEEYEAGTNPMDSDNEPPTASVAIAMADGVRATFDVSFADPEGNTMTLDYAFDGGAPQTMDVAGLASPVTIEHTFNTAGTHTMTVTAFDGALRSPEASATYSVYVPSGASNYYPINGPSEGSFHGTFEGLSAAPVTFVTGRDGAGRGAAHVNLSGNHGILTSDIVTLPDDFTVSAWIQLGDVYSDVSVLGQHGVFVLSANPSELRLHSMGTDTYPNSSNRVAAGTIPHDRFVMVSVVVSGGTSTLYIGAEMIGSGAIASTRTNCTFFFGQPTNGETWCTNMVRAEEFENGVNAAFDDIRIYPRALSANEIAALVLN